MDDIVMQARVSELQGIPVTTVQLISTVYNATTALCTVAFILKNCVPPYPPALSTHTVPGQPVIQVDWFDDSINQGKELIPYSSLKKHTASDRPISLQTLRHVYKQNINDVNRENKLPLLTTNRSPQPLPRFQCLWLPGIESQQFHSSYGIRPMDIWDICLPKSEQINDPSQLKFVDNEVTRVIRNRVANSQEYTSLKAAHSITRKTLSLTSPSTAAVRPILLPLIWLTPEVVVVNWMSIPWRSRISKLTRRTIDGREPVKDQRVIAEHSSTTLPRMAFVVDRGFRASGVDALPVANSYLNNSLFQDFLAYKLTDDELVHFDIGVNLSAVDTDSVAENTTTRPVFNVETILLGRPLPTSDNQNPPTKYLTIAYFSAAGQRDTDHNFSLTWTVCSMSDCPDTNHPLTRLENSVNRPNDNTSSFPYNARDDANTTFSNHKSARHQSNRPFVKSCTSGVTQKLSATLHTGVAYTVSTIEWSHRICYAMGSSIQYQVIDTYDRRKPHNREDATRDNSGDKQSVMYKSARLMLPLDFVGILEISTQATDSFELRSSKADFMSTLTTNIVADTRSATHHLSKSTQKRLVGRVASFKFFWYFHTISRSTVTALDSGDLTDVVLDIDTGCGGRYPEPYSVIIDRVTINRRWFTIISRPHPEQPGNIYFVALPCFEEGLKDSHVQSTPWCNHNQSIFQVTLQCHETPLDYSSDMEAAGLGLTSGNATTPAAHNKTPVVFVPAPLDLTLTEMNETYTWTPFAKTGILFSITTMLMGSSGWDTVQQREAGGIMGGGGDARANFYTTLFYFSKFGDYQRSHRFNVSHTVTGYSDDLDRHLVTAMGPETPVVSVNLDDRRDYGIFFYEWSIVLPLTDLSVKYIVTDEYQTLVTAADVAFPGMLAVVDTYSSTNYSLDPDGKSHSYEYYFSWFEFHDVDAIRTPTHFYMISRLTRCPVGWPEQALEVEGRLLHRFAHQNEDSQYVFDTSGTIKLSCPVMEDRAQMEHNSVILSQMPWCRFNPPKTISVRLFCGQGPRKNPVSHENRT